MAEVLIAGVVLVTALCSYFAVLQESLRALDTARSSTLAAQVMRSEIERLRML